MDTTILKMRQNLFWHVASGERFEIEALAGFLAAYRRSVDVKRSRAAILIKNAGDALQQQPEEARLVALLSNALQFWGLLCRPLRGIIRSYVAATLT
jgi:hypothetical protein